MTKFDRETFVTTGFLKEGGIKLVLFCPTEVVMLGPAKVVMVLLSPIEVVIIVKILDMILIESLSKIIKIIISLITLNS